MPRKNVRHILAHLSWTSHKLEYGIRAYAREANWTLTFLRNADDFGGGSKAIDGVLALLPQLDLVNLRSLYPNAKIVNLNGMPGMDLHSQFDGAVSCDHKAVARLAAQHLVQLGARSFLAFALKRCEPEVTRIRHFSQFLIEHSLEFKECYLDAWSELLVFDPLKASRQVSKVLRCCELPLCVFAPGDLMADVFIQIALDLGYSIPGDISVIGIDNSREICENCRVPITSVDSNLSRLGYEASRLLDQLIEGRRVEEIFVTIPPLRIEKRSSTNETMETDCTAELIRRYIREHFSEQISLETIAEDLRISRSTAFSRFARSVGHSIGKEIMMVRMENARSMLLNTDYKIDVVAWMNGYKDSSAFGRIFKKLYQTTPSDFRKRGVLEADSANVDG